MCWTITFAVLAGISALPTEADDDCRPASVVTFNAGLTPMIPQYETRKAQIAQALKKTKADVICLQEVTYEEDITDLLDELKWKYPFSWSFLHTTSLTWLQIFASRFGGYFRSDGEKRFPCDDESFGPFLECSSDQCSSESGGLSLLLCLFTRCNVQIFALPEDCLSCLAGSASSNETAISKCATQRAGRNRYQAEDVLILSKKPIFSARSIRFIPNIKQVFPRGLLEVDIKDIGRVLCTHLTADLTPVNVSFIEVNLAISLGITNYEDQQADEIAKIQLRYSGTSVILAGDMNAGPTVPAQNISGELTQNYDDLISQGFDNPYVDLVGECTYCPDNPIAVPQNNILDHVLLRGYSYVDASRILDDATNPLSDHYGVKVRFCRPEYDD